MGIRKMDIRKKSLAIGLFLASPAAFGKGSGSAVVGVDRLVLSETPSQNASICYATGKSGSYVADAMTVVADATNSSAVQLKFTVNDIVPDSGNGTMTLFLAYGTSKSTTPQLPTKNTTYPFLLLGGLQVLTAYNVEPLRSLDQAPVSIGQASGKPSSTLTFSVALDRTKIANLIAQSSGVLYFQAGLMPTSDLATGSVARAIFSEVDTVTFARSCPSSATTTAQADASGGKTATTQGKSGTSSSGKTTSSSGKSSSASSSSTGK
jgi:hypothetical protein